jgi:ribosomal protein S27AE
MTTKVSRQVEVSMVPVKLSYCPRCGTLRAQSEDAGREICAACVRFLEWVRTGCRRPLRRRPRRKPAVAGGRP